MFHKCHFLKLKIIFNWRIIALQYCVGFSHTATCQPQVYICPLSLEPSYRDLTHPKMPNFFFFFFTNCWFESGSSWSPHVAINWYVLSFSFNLCTHLPSLAGSSTLFLPFSIFHMHSFYLHFIWRNIVVCPWEFYIIQISVSASP